MLTAERRDAGRNCGTCSYWQPAPRAETARPPWPGQCHRHPPMLDTSSETTRWRFPNVSSTEWCGEYAPTDEITARAMSQTEQADEPDTRPQRVAQTGARPKPVGEWHMVTCAICGLLVGWTRKPLQRPFYCIPHFDEVAHLPDEELAP